MSSHLVRTSKAAFNLVSEISKASNIPCSKLVSEAILRTYNPQLTVIESIDTTKELDALIERISVVSYEIRSKLKDIKEDKRAKSIVLTALQAIQASQSSRVKATTTIPTKATTIPTKEESINQSDIVDPDLDDVEFNPDDFGEIGGYDE